MGLAMFDEWLKLKGRHIQLKKGRGIISPQENYSLCKTYYDRRQLWLSGNNIQAVQHQSNNKTEICVK